jgi:hypothetical protein
MTSTRGPDEGDTSLEAPEADVAEQQIPVDPAELDDTDDPIPPVRVSDVDADEGDLLEQAMPVALEDDDQ